MAIDLTRDEVFPLTTAAGRLPSVRGGRSVHVGTLHRWARKGVRGIRLDVIQLGGTLCTSQRSLREFFEALTSKQQPAESKTAAADTSTVDRQLDALGL
jgi:hypothetical protein